MFEFKTFHADFQIFGDSIGDSEPKFSSWTQAQELGFRHLPRASQTGEVMCNSRLRHDWLVILFPWLF